MWLDSSITIDVFFNPIMLSGFSILTLWSSSLQYKECLVSFSYDTMFFLLFFFFFSDIPVFNVYSVDPDQMPQSVASDLGLHCLPMFLL